MNKTARGILFWMFIVFFLITAPVSVLYTAGYRYNFQSGSFVRTGVISVTSSPRNAKLYLDDELIEKTSPYVIKRITPGEYTLRIEKEGYHSWEGAVTVRSGETTNIHNILLFIDQEPKELFIKKNSQITPSPDGRFAAYLIQEGGWEEIWLYDTQEESPSLVDRYTYYSGDDTVMQWSSDGSRFFVQNEASEILRFYENSGNSLEVVDSILEDTTNIFWHPSEGHILYVSTDNALKQYDFRDESFEIFDEEAAISVLIDASTLTFIDNGNNVELYQMSIGERKLIALLPRASYDVVLRDGSYLIIEDTRNNIVLIDIRSEQPILLETYAHTFDWNESEDLLVYSDGNEVNIYSPGSHSIEFITRQSDFIETIKWHASGSTILVATNAILASIETYAIAEQRMITNIAEMQSIADFWTSEDGKHAYIYGMLNGAEGLYELTLTK